jgi:steroid delta-isomerase-like uncharacterized protein
MKRRGLAMFARISRIVLVGLLSVALGGVFQASAQTEENKPIVQREADEIWNQGNLDVADELFATDFVNHDFNPPGVTDLEGYKGWVLKWRAAFPDYHVEIHDLVAEGDKVGIRYTVTGTHQGDFFGIEATGIQVTMMGINMYRLDGGKIAEVLRTYDLLGLGQQIGYCEPIPEEVFPFSFGRRTNPEDFVWGPDSDVTGDSGDPETNKAIIVREYEGWNTGNLDGILEPISPDLVNHDIYPEVTDYESYVQWVTPYGNPDDPSIVTLEDMIAEGDKVMEHWTAQGGRLIGISASRFADGKIVDRWRSLNVLPVFIVIGLVPAFPEFTTVESSTWGQIKSLFQE